jgi:hypothetical protein
LRGVTDLTVKLELFLFVLSEKVILFEVPINKVLLIVLAIVFELRAILVDDTTKIIGGIIGSKDIVHRDVLDNVVAAGFGLPILRALTLTIPIMGTVVLMDLSIDDDFHEYSLFYLI